MSNSLPNKGFVFWPVGTGDSTTIVVDASIIVQVDLNHMTAAEEDDNPGVPVVDELVRVLPKKKKKPYLSVFVLTHPDLDHCRGFARLLDEVTIGELWFTPRVFTEYNSDLCDDAKAFRTEAKRRIKATIDADGSVGAGDRVRIIGYDDKLKEAEYKGFPKSLLTVPGSSVAELDGVDVSTSFRAFIHAPFKDDISSERNNSSVGLQVTLYEGDELGRALLLGDLCYPTVNRIFQKSAADDLKWSIFLAPHHCSKSVMFWADEADGDPEIQQALLDLIEAAAEPDGYVVASSHPIPTKNEKGDNPPHAKAKKEYEVVAPKGLVCTMEYPNEKAPAMMVFTMTVDGLVLSEASDGDADAAATLKSAIDDARGGPPPAHDRVGFGTTK